MNKDTTLLDEVRENIHLTIDELVQRDVPHDDYGNPTLPTNVGRAINIWARQNNYGTYTPFDSGIHTIAGALNVGVASNHCTIFYFQCEGKAFGNGITSIERNDYNRSTYNRIVAFLRRAQLTGGGR